MMEQKGRGKERMERTYIRFADDITTATSLVLTHLDCRKYELD
jgi:hypothetical protein